MSQYGFDEKQQLKVKLELMRKNDDSSWNLQDPIFSVVNSERGVIRHIVMNIF